ncbi:MAG: HEPN domain-containing protein [Gemmatimonadota bacterium]
MSEQHELLRVLQQWVEKAENDLRNAEHTLKLGAEGPLDTVCFHAQQCVEKYVKAVLALHAIDFPKIHDIAELVASMPDPSVIGLSSPEQERLTDYATVTRYPGNYNPITLSEAAAAVEIARRARACLRGQLPAR